MAIDPKQNRSGTAILDAVRRAARQEQFLEVVEIQVNEADTAAASFFQRLGFSHVDIGHVYQKKNHGSHG